MRATILPAPRLLTSGPRPSGHHLRLRRGREPARGQRPAPRLGEPPGRAHGASSVRTPQTGQRSRRISACRKSLVAPRSRCRQRRARSCTTTPAGVNSTLLNAVLTRTCLPSSGKVQPTVGPNPTRERHVRVGRVALHGLPRSCSTCSPTVERIRTAAQPPTGTLGPSFQASVRGQFFTRRRYFERELTGYGRLSRADAGPN